MNDNNLNDVLNEYFKKKDDSYGVYPKDIFIEGLNALDIQKCCLKLANDGFLKTTVVKIN